MELGIAIGAMVLALLDLIVLFVLSGKAQEARKANADAIFRVSEVLATSTAKAVDERQGLAESLDELHGKTEAAEARDAEERRRIRQALVDEVAEAADGRKGLADALSASSDKLRSDAGAAAEEARQARDRIAGSLDEFRNESRAAIESLETRSEEARQARDRITESAEQFRRDSAAAMESLEGRGQDSLRQLAETVERYQEESRGRLEAICEEGRAERGRLGEAIERFQSELRTGWDAFSTREEAARQDLSERVNWFEETTRKRMSELDDLSERTREQIHQLESYIKEFFEAELKSVFQSLDNTVGAVLGEMRDELLRGVQRIDEIQSVVHGQKSAESRVLERETGAFSLLSGETAASGGAAVEPEPVTSDPETADAHNPGPAEARRVRRPAARPKAPVGVGQASSRKTQRRPRGLMSFLLRRPR